MNVEFTAVFKKYDNGNTHVQIPSLIVKKMRLKHGDVLSIDYINDNIIIKKTTEGNI